MRNLYLGADELYYLGLYQGIDSIFGVPYHNFGGSTLENLIKKEVLNKEGKVNNATVGIIEYLKEYMKADIYIHIHQFWFGVFKNGSCITIVEAERKEKKEYEIFICDILSLTRIAMSHDIFRQSVIKQYNETIKENDNYKEMEDKYIEDDILLIEQYNKAKELEDKLLVGVKGNRYYALDESLNFINEIETVNCFKWLTDHIPQYGKYMEVFFQELGVNSGRENCN